MIGEDHLLSKILTGKRIMQAGLVETGYKNPDISNYYICAYTANKISFINRGFVLTYYYGPFVLY